MTRLLAIPTKRDQPSFSAMKAALKCLSGGEIVGIFPEGKVRQRTRDVENTQLKRGACFLARKARVPLVPVHISWTGFFIFKRAALIIDRQIEVGEVIDEEQCIEILTDRLKWLETHAQHAFCHNEQLKEFYKHEQA